jgi:hypothetical protein
MKKDNGSIDLVQAVIACIILLVASIGVMKILNVGKDLQDWEVRHKKALILARSEAEVIQNRLSCSFDAGTLELLNGNEGRPVKKKLDDQIDCLVSHSSMAEVDKVETGQGIDYYMYSITVKWKEPNETTERKVVLNATGVRE